LTTNDAHAGADLGAEVHDDASPVLSVPGSTVSAVSVPSNPTPRPTPAPAPQSPAAFPTPAATAAREHDAGPEVLAAHALQPLDDLGERDVVEHPAAYDAVHRALSALLNADSADAGRR
jgi:hypothetical protein